MANKKTAAIVKKQQPPAVLAQQWLNQRSDKLAEWCVAGSGIDPVTLIRVGSRLVAKEDKFQDSRTWPSLYLALITAAQLGLEPDGPRGEAYLIPYWDSKMKCYLVQLQPGYRGMMKLITQSGEIRTIRSQVVHENDIFEMQLGTNKRVDHQPAWKDRGVAVAVYSIATYANGDEDYELASWEDVMKAKASAKGKSPAWDNWPDQMARKFVIKRHSNQLPLDPVARQAVAIDNIDTDSASSDTARVIDAEIVEEQAKALPASSNDKQSSALEKKLAERKAKTLKKEKSVARKDDDASREKHTGEKPTEEKEAPAKEVEEPDFPQCELCGFEAPRGEELCGDCRSSVADSESDQG